MKLTIEQMLAIKATGSYNDKQAEIVAYVRNELQRIALEAFAQNGAPLEPTVEVSDYVSDLRWRKNRESHGS